MITKKSIAYAYPSSSRAKELGFDKQGCYFIQLQTFNYEKLSVSLPYLPPNTIGFLEPDSPDMIRFFLEIECEIDKHFLRYGNPKTIAAITKAMEGVLC